MQAAGPLPSVIGCLWGSVTVTAAVLATTGLQQSQHNWLAKTEELTRTSMFLHLKIGKDQPAVEFRRRVQKINFFWKAVSKTQTVVSEHHSSD